MFANIEDYQKFTKDQMDAVTKASAGLTKTMQLMAAEATDYSKKSLETATTALEKLMGAKSLDKAIEVQTDYAKTAYESFMAQAAKMGDLYTTLAKDAFKPMEGMLAKANVPAK